MAKKQKCECPDPGLTAPFYMLTYGDMMTLLLCFFILLFAMSTIEVSKFQAQVAIMQGSLGISEMYEHAPMQQNLPAPAVKQSKRIIAQASVTPTATHSTNDSLSVQSVDPDRDSDEQKMRAIHTLGMQADLEIQQLRDDIVMTLPLYGIFDKGQYKVNHDSPQVQKFRPIYANLATQIALLSNYDITFVGHTDTLPLERFPGTTEGPKNNTELGFRRAVAMYEYFFEPYLQDKTRITYASQGDNIPIIPNATLDSEHRKNRRVQIHLKKKQPHFAGYAVTE